MRSLLIAAAITTMICTALAALTAIVFCLGMGANSTPAQIRALKLWMAGLSLLGAAGIGTGVFLLRAGQPAWAAGVRMAPTLVMGVIFLVAMLK